VFDDRKGNGSGESLEYDNRRTRFR
jgi:hypothetical protein